MSVLHEVANAFAALFVLGMVFTGMSVLCALTSLAQTLCHEPVCETSVLLINANFRV
jgi:hypothetical protein